MQAHKVDFVEDIYKERPTHIRRNFAQAMYTPDSGSQKYKEQHSNKSATSLSPSDERISTETGN